ncbi:hypothetical protein NEOLEDRAFT_1070267 [Neolentinus lepideus HHB14362 ss-1]|uniref:DUF1365-domain-containing protein n=1 Tax=Neolentinus lepideus HHB14362 ss-1 TaxID=1314782 RepID=A0A165QXG1_9AGAM|nr:hypothetical protein NEOLEDRAFT_1070267 [Neolentinus lepideus HHB14362 ss-1]
MNVAAGAGCVTVLCLVLSYLRSSDSQDRPTAYILNSKVTHARLLPLRSTHAFTYPTLTLLLPLKALEDNRLDLGGGWIFGYGGLYGRLTGLRPSAYLIDNGQDGKTIWRKLTQILFERNYDASNLDDAWMMTMPSFLGYEGINPLTVYYCYNMAGELWLIVLEVHNTFGERHVYILEVGRNQDTPDTGSFDCQWTFRRHFHVSPFNDRLGFYTASFTVPSHPPAKASGGPSPCPLVRINYHPFDESSSEPTPGPLKLTAFIRPISSTPFTTSRWLFSLASSPLRLLLTLPRILYQAWILHYKKRLDVYARPEPKPVGEDWSSAGIPIGDQGGVGWQAEGMLEAYCRRRLEVFLTERVNEINVEITLIPANPSLPPSHFAPTEAATDHLKIYYTSPKFFTMLFMCPSPAHAVWLGATENIFSCSGDHFLDVFHLTEPTTWSLKETPNPSQYLRVVQIPGNFQWTYPRVHALEHHASNPRKVANFIVLYILVLLNRLEEILFGILRARFIPGQEPWNAWNRALYRLQHAGEG